MPSRRFDWHEHLSSVAREYAATRLAVDRFQANIVAEPDLVPEKSKLRKGLRNADANLEGTYIVRLFAAFEAALRSYDRAQHHDPTRASDASTLIDQIGGRHGCRIDAIVRQHAQEVRRVRNYWAHESDENPGAMPITEVSARLQAYLSKLPPEWG